MDIHYNKISAATTLDQVVADRASLHNDDMPSDQLADLDIERVDAEIFSQPTKCWKLVDMTEEDTKEEAVLRIQGAVYAKMLPPVARPANRAVMAKQRPYLKQSVSITGLGTHAFQQAVEKIELIYLAFSNKLPDGALHPMDHVYNGEEVGVEASTRYFDRKHDKQDQAPEEILTSRYGHFVDPYGVLQSMECDGFYHGEENIVRYATKVDKPDGGIEYKSLNPATLRVGDIVELSISFSVYPCKEGRFKMVNRLKGVLLLDHKDRDKAAILRMRSRNPTAGCIKAGVKRKMLYSDEEAVEHTQRRLSKMRLS